MGKLPDGTIRLLGGWGARKLPSFQDSEEAIRPNHIHRARKGPMYRQKMRGLSTRPINPRVGRMKGNEGIA